MGQVGPSFLKGTVRCNRENIGFRKDELIGGRDKNQSRPVWWCLPVILAPRK